jgi:hypothetical protein
MINGVKNGSPLKPTITADMISSLFIEHSKIIGNVYNRSPTSNINQDNFENSSRDYVSEYRQQHPSERPSKNNLKIKSDILKTSADSNLSDLNSLLENKQTGNDAMDMKTLPRNMTLNSRTSSENAKTFGFQPEGRKGSQALGSQETSADLSSARGKILHDRMDSETLLPVDYNTNATDLLNQERYLPHYAGLETEYIYRNLLEKFKKSGIQIGTSEPSITINVGKITVRAVKDSKFSSHIVSSDEPRRSNKLSLSDYLRKRAERM